MVNYKLVMYMNVFRLPGYLTIRYEIESQISDLRKQGIQPTLVRLSDKASVQFAYESGKSGRVSNAPKLFSGPNCLCHIIYRDPTVRWVAVEGIPKKEFNKLLREGKSALRELYGI
ncbi:MAG TPA: hypothetical protein DD734_07800 [Firmicutes bacterium]|nr:hypothetical protein [Bacillota bacterium]